VWAGGSAGLITDSHWSRQQLGAGWWASALADRCTGAAAWCPTADEQTSAVWNATCCGKHAPTAMTRLPRAADDILVWTARGPGPDF
jgi:hypothetical protein